MINDYFWFYHFKTLVLKNYILNVNKQLNSPDTRNIFSPADKKNSKKLADGNFVEERYSPFIFL